MSSKAKKLGGLADLYQREHLDGTVTKIKVSQLFPSKNQPRQNRKDQIEELAGSIHKDGLLSPIVVTKEGRDKYRIIAGERRFHAITSLGWIETECKIISRDKLDYQRIAIVENLLRKNLSAQEEAAALLQLKKEGDLSDADIATTTGKSRNYITEILSINNLPGQVLDECNNAGITNKNILIQASQAHKKGIFPEFLNAYNGGTIKTVKQAKEFNRPQSETKPSITPKTTLQQELSATIVRTKSTIVISCKDEQAAMEIEKTIRRLV